MSIEDKLTAIIEETHRCIDCNERTDRFILFYTPGGLVEAFECIDCRQKRVQRQVDAGLRPASDLLPENLPERRNPA